MSDVSVGIRRKAGETWREALERIAKPFGLEEECLTLYDLYVASGNEESEAASSAAWDWDICEIMTEEI